MPERKRPTVAIVAAHERRKTVDGILNTASAEVSPQVTQFGRRVGRVVGRSFPIMDEPTLLGNAAFHNMNTYYENSSDNCTFIQSGISQFSKQRVSSDDWLSDSL